MRIPNGDGRFRVARWFWLPIVLLVMVGCGPRDSSGDSGSDNTTQVASGFTIELTEDQRAFLTGLRDRGLRVATTLSDAVYEPLPDGSADGVQYRLLQSFCDHFDLDFTVEVIPFSHYFTRGDTVAKAGEIPDIFDRVDLLVDTITVLPWREDLMLFVPIIPTRLVLVTKKGLELSDEKSLGDLTYSIHPNTAGEEALRNLGEQLGRTIDIIYVDGVQDEARAVSEGRSDATVQDADSAILNLKAWPDLTINRPLTDFQQLAWGVNPREKPLQEILLKYVEYAREEGILDQLWTDYYGFSLIEYLQLLGE